MGPARVVPQVKLTLFVCRSSQQWVVLDPDGNFWLLPSVENPWDQRQPFYPTEERARACSRALQIHARSAFLLKVRCINDRGASPARGGSSQERPLEKVGPYLSERQWGTVREDYSEGGNAWDYFSHDQARSRAYRWGEDGDLVLFDTVGMKQPVRLPLPSYCSFANLKH